MYINRFDILSAQSSIYVSFCAPYTFTIAPYARYFFLNSDVVRLFADGGFGFSTSKTKGNDALNSWNIGIKPGIAIKLSDHFCLVAKYGFLGYSKKENRGTAIYDIQEAGYNPK